MSGPILFLINDEPPCFISCGSLELPKECWKAGVGADVVEEYTNEGEENNGRGNVEENILTLVLVFKVQGKVSEDCKIH